LKPRAKKWQDGDMSAAVLLIVVLVIAIVPVAMVLRSKRRRLGTRASGDAAQADPQSTLRIGDSAGGAGSATGAAPAAVLGGNVGTPSSAAPGKRIDPRAPARGPAARERKPGSKDAAVASDPQSTLKLS
jgi:hypothetical protein